VAPGRGGEPAHRHRADATVRRLGEQATHPSIGRSSADSGQTHGLARTAAGLARPAAVMSATMLPPA
jgi:hypothetical protein